MKQKLFIFRFAHPARRRPGRTERGVLCRTQKTPDREFSPNRSTYNSGATGTGHFYDLLHETGRKVIRWEVALPHYCQQRAMGRQFFVIIGEIRREFENTEAEQLFEWVQAGGRLVVIDREPPEGLIATYANWTVVFQPKNWNEIFRVDPTDQQQMISETRGQTGTADAAYGKRECDTAVTIWLRTSLCGG